VASGSLPASCDCFVEYVVGGVEFSVGGFAPANLGEGFDGVRVMNVCFAIPGYEGSRVKEESQRLRESSSP